VYVGDSLTDAEAAKGAGLHFIACLEAGIRTRDDFAIHPVDRFIERFADLPEAVKSLD
jgi:phosphoglycolate phosphatase-like HAD superfamily hydrolase